MGWWPASLGSAQAGGQDRPAVPKARVGCAAAWRRAGRLCFGAWRCWPAGWVLGAGGLAGLGDDPYGVWMGTGLRLGAPRLGGYSPLVRLSQKEAARKTQPIIAGKPAMINFASIGWNG